MGGSSQVSRAGEGCPCVTWWQGLLVGVVLGAYLSFALSAYAFSRMRVDPVVAEWVIASILAALASVLFALSWA